MANGCPGIPAAVVQQDEETPPENMRKMQTPAQQEGNPHELQISLYVKVLSIVNSQITVKIDLYIGVLEVNESLKTVGLPSTKAVCNLKISEVFIFSFEEFKSLGSMRSQCFYLARMHYIYQK